MILGPGEGHAHYSARGSEMFFKATAELDGGDLSLMERTLPPGGRRPPARRHTNCSEAYFVLDGAGLDHRRGRGAHRRARGVRAGPAGHRAHLRKHQRRARPAAGDPHPAMDGYFAGLHELWNRPEPPSPDEEGALMSRFGMDPA